MDDNRVFQLRRGFKTTDEDGNIIQDDWGAYESQEGHVKPLEGELVLEYENDMPKIKVGDGEHEFSELPELGNSDNNKSDTDAIILRSSTEGSTKKFKITIEDDGTLKATEVSE